jgi:probable O-glycosylation ligase (exosortase A-associated)
MVVLTLIGAVGSFAVEPFLGVAVYYLFAVLRPQYLWEWVLPQWGWSGYVAYSTIAATLWFLMSAPATPAGGTDPVKYSFAHKAYFMFGFWVCLTYFTAINQAAAYDWFVEYLKLFLMFGIATLVISRIQQIWALYLIATSCLTYIAYELNFLYFTAGRVDIYNNGYGGLDNNGAGLMIAMGIPLAVHAWEACRKWWRWIFIAAVPILMHAVLMSFSRGAMVSTLAVVPLLVMRSRKKKQFALVFVLLVWTVPYLAGTEIRQRFFTVEDYANDESANSRYDSWGAAVRIANDNPILGVGIRNSNLLSYAYGADMEGRTIHSQYLQTAADNGWVGLFLYLLALGSAWVAIIRTRWSLRKRTDKDAFLARSMLSGIEGSLAIFCVGATFLSLEVFELPYLVGFMGVQLSLLMRLRPQDDAVVAGAGQNEAPAQAPLRPHPMLS